MYIDWDTDEEKDEASRTEEGEKEKMKRIRKLGKGPADRIGEE